ncbi:MAG: hypothetical protein U5L04_07215 [Trueperaceae bacterium]|nr:hypothetical protein [Trueperaceae bacterium]
MVGLMVAANPAYVGQQYIEYVRFLGVLSRDFPWRGPGARFLGYNHSIKQIFVYLAGVEPRMLQLATLAKNVLIGSIGLGLSALSHPSC